MTDDRARRIDAVYAKLPRLTCARKCGDACGPIAMCSVEADRLRGILPVRPPRFEAQAGGHVFLTGDPLDPTMDCPYLTPVGSCKAYGARPAICRLFGLVKDRLECPHGCVPERWLSHEEALAVLAEIDAIAEGGREGARRPDLDISGTALAGDDARNWPEGAKDWKTGQPVFPEGAAMKER